MSQSVGSEKCNEQKAVNLDRILIEEVGLCGRFQLRVLALCFLLALLGGTQVNIYLFTFNKVNTRCVIPECEIIDSPANFTSPWLLHAIPKDGSYFDNCHRFAPVPNNASDFCSADLFDRNSTMECEDYVYEHTNSAIFEYNLACDNWRPNLVGSLVAVGNILALPIGGFIADRWGRRVALTLSAVNLAWIGAMLYFPNTFISYVLIGFVAALVGGSYYSNSYVLAIEYVAPKHRVAVTGAMSSLAALGRVITAIIMSTDRYWRNLILIIYCPFFITIVYFWVVPESVRWLLSKNRHIEAKNTLRRAAEINGKTLSEKTLRSIRDYECKVAKVKDKKPEAWLVCLIFKHKIILLRCVVTPIWWLTTVLVFHGLSISSIAMSGNRFVNYSLVCAVAIPGYWVTVVLSDRIGRRPLLMAAFWICGASQFVYIIIPKGHYWLTLIVFLVGKLSISTCNTLNYIYTAELYPTRYRASLLAFSSTVGRIGTVLAPLAPALAAEIWEYLPFAIFGSMAFLASFLVPLVPETLGTTLPDTMEEAVNLSRGQPQPFNILRHLRRLMCRKKSYTIKSVGCGLYSRCLQSTFDKVNTRCLIPQCESNNSSSNFTPSWILNAIPTAGSSFDNCRRFVPVSDNVSDICSADLFDRYSSVECKEYVYEHKNSAIFEYNLACDNWRSNLVGSLVAVGNILALPIGGFVADRWGRRVALTLSAVNLAWIGAMLYFANTFISYVLIGFVGALVGGSYYTNTFILAVECVGSKHRVAVSATLSSIASLGRILTAVIMSTEPYWRNLILIIYCPLFISIFYFWVAPESIRWFLSKNRNEDAKNFLKNAAEINGNSLSEKTVQSLQDIKSKVAEENDKSDPWLVCLVFKHKPILLRCMVTPTWWLVTVFVFYGLQISSARVNISGNRFVNYSLVSAVGIPGFWTAAVLSNRIGRKPLLMAAFWICGASQLAFIFIPKGNYWLSLTMFLVGKLSISTCNTLNYIYTAELYPTRYRASLLAFSSAVGRIGTVLAPLAPAIAAEVWEYLPFVVFSVMAFLAGFLVPLVPETLGTTLPDTMEEAANLGKGQTKSCRILQPLRRLVFRRKCYTVQ